jgi:hypothetical protein
MAIVIACAPVIYPWYLLYVTPFLFSIATLPLALWSLSGLSVYVVWDLSRHGARWIPPYWVMALELVTLVCAGIAAVAWSRTSAADERESRN